ncbi:ArsR/SmtB family transcription factor [Kitasatospora sp. NPDC092039]|uniref:ArsR/SmtB family transcription factor n=1 Tax=Kitasatospora sp. NPDC092039 TaxID=3364086 RepID=UPI00380F678D
MPGTIDAAAVEAAAAAANDRDRLQGAADRFALLAEPGRLAVLVALRAAGAIAVSDLALACGMNPPAVSQVLRLLRVSGVVKPTRSGRIVRYALCDERVVRLLDDAVPAHG